MNNLPTQQQNPDGLHARYIVKKSDGAPTDKEAMYFVLRLDPKGDDPAHIVACREAVSVYIRMIRATIPGLADDLQKYLDDTEEGVQQMYNNIEV